MMSYLAKAFVMLLVLLGCSRVDKRVEKFGEMTLTEYVRVSTPDIDAYHAQIERAELCTPREEYCFVGSDLKVKAYDSTAVGRLVVSISDYGGPKFPIRSEFFDTKLGKRIHCECRYLDGIMFTGEWLQDGRVYLLRGLNQTLGYYIQVIEFDELLAKDRIFTYQRNADYVASEYKVDNAKTGLAWVACNKFCSMYWINGLLTEVKTRATLCKVYTLMIEWKDGEPQLLRRDGGDVDKCGS